MLFWLDPNMCSKHINRCAVQNSVSNVHLKCEEWRLSCFTTTNEDKDTNFVNYPQRALLVLIKVYFFLRKNPTLYQKITLKSYSFTNRSLTLHNSLEFWFSKLTMFTLMIKKLTSRHHVVTESILTLFQQDESQLLLFQVHQHIVKCPTRWYLYIVIWVYVLICICISQPGSQMKYSAEMY